MVAVDVDKSEHLIWESEHLIWERSAVLPCLTLSGPAAAKRQPSGAPAT